MIDSYFSAPYSSLSPEKYSEKFAILNQLCHPQSSLPIVAHCICAALHGGPQQQLQYFSRFARGDGLLHACIDEHLYPHMAPDTSGDLLQSGLFICRRHAEHARLFLSTATPQQFAFARFLPSDHGVRSLIAAMAGLLSVLRPQLLVSWHPVGVPPMDTALWAALLVGVPQILIRFNSTSPMAGPEAHRMPKWLTEQMHFLVRSHRVSLCANSHAGSASHAEWLALERSAIPVIPNGFDTSRKNSSEQEQCEFRERLRIPPKAPLLVGIFRLNAGKNLEVFAHVAKNVALKVPDVHIIHAGGGPCADTFPHLLAAAGVRERTILLGAVSEKEIDTLLACSDVLVSPSQQEGLSNVWLEAMFHGAVPVVFETGDAARVIQHGHCGFVHPQGDIVCMSQSVVKLFRDTALRRRMAAAGHARVVRDYALETFAQALQQKILLTLQSKC